MSAFVVCSRCAAPIPPDFCNTGVFAPCTKCGSSLRVDIFRALTHPPEKAPSGKPIMIPGESSCFYHPAKAAEIVCEGCGRFLCSLCDIELARQHLCTVCIAAGKQKGKLKNLENHRVLYDRITLTLAVAPILTVIFTILTAPAALFMCFRYWREPTSLVHPSKSLFVLAAILSVAQIAIWILVIARITKLTMA